MSLPAGGAAAAKQKDPLGLRPPQRVTWLLGGRGRIPCPQRNSAPAITAPPSGLPERYGGNRGLSSGLQSSRIRNPLTCREDQEAFRGPVDVTDLKERRTVYVGGSLSGRSRLCSIGGPGGHHDQRPMRVRQPRFGKAGIVRRVGVGPDQADGGRYTTAARLPCRSGDGLALDLGPGPPNPEPIPLPPQPLDIRSVHPHAASRPVPKSDGADPSRTRPVELVILVISPENSRVAS